jgi:hypothetical protein
MTDKADKPASALKPEMLTPEELEDLRRDAKEKGAYFRKAFAHLRPKSQR